MMNKLMNRWLVLPLLLIAAPASFSQTNNGTPPTGAITFSFDTNSAPVFDLTGSYTLDQVTDEGNDLNFGITLSQDVRGMLSGSGQTLISLSGSALFAGNYTAKGKISGGGAHPTKVTLNVHLSGSDTVLGRATTFNVTIEYELNIDPASLVMSGNAHGHASFSGLGSNHIKTTITPITVAPGTWQLQMTIAPFSKNKLEGTGLITLANGRMLQTHLTGHYNPTTDLSKVKLSGYGDSRGTTLTVEFTSGGLQSLNGKILNQNVVE